MKLGKLLLSGFRRKVVSKNAGHRKSTQRKSTQRNPALKSRVNRPLKSPGLEKARKQLAAPLVETGLRTSDLIRPGPHLKKSLEGFLLDQRSPHTRKAYSKDLKRFVQFLMVRALTQKDESLNRSILIAYKDFLLSEKLEATTIDRHLASLKSFFKWLVDDGLIPKSPADGVRFLNPKKLSKTSGFSDSEVRKILALPNLHTRTGAQHYAILMILFYAGLRRSEICDLRIPHLSIERGHPILKLRGKGNSERIVVLATPVWNALQHYFRITGRSPGQDLPLFTAIRNNRTGVLMRPLDPSMIYYIVTRYARAAGIHHRVSPHSCRATAISNARDHQVADRAIQEFAGWSSPQMITHYDKRKSSIEKSAAHSIDYGAAEQTLPLLR